MLALGLRATRPCLFLIVLTSEIPKISYGFQILGMIFCVVTIRYTMPAMRAHPRTTKMARLILRCFLFCAARSDATTSPCLMV